VLPVSARAGDGIARWYDWLRRQARAGTALASDGDSLGRGGG